MKIISNIDEEIKESDVQGYTSEQWFYVAADLNKVLSAVISWISIIVIILASIYTGKHSTASNGWLTFFISSIGLIIYSVCSTIVTMVLYGLSSMRREDYRYKNNKLEANNNSNKTEIE